MQFHCTTHQSTDNLPSKYFYARTVIRKGKLLPMQPLAWEYNNKADAERALLEKDPAFVVDLEKDDMTLELEWNTFTWTSSATVSRYDSYGFKELRRDMAMLVATEHGFFPDVFCYLAQGGKMTETDYVEYIGKALTGRALTSAGVAFNADKIKRRDFEDQQRKARQHRDARHNAVVREQVWGQLKGLKQ